MESLAIGLSLGLLGGVHCVTMCGPVAAFLHHKSTLKYSVLIYNSGRLITYLLLGLTVGVVGEQLAIFGYQQVISIVSGSMILVFLFVPQVAKSTNKIYFTNGRLVAVLRARLLKVTTTKSATAYLGLGMLNGLLPCGLVYVALVASFNASNSLSSFMLMLGFGLGTWPLMSVIMSAGSIMMQHVRIKKLIPTLSIIIGIFLILRGMALDIPYLSPIISSLGWDVGITTCN